MHLGCSHGHKNWLYRMLSCGVEFKASQRGIMEKYQYISPEEKCIWGVVTGIKTGCIVC